MEKDFDEYEKEYLEKLEQKKKENDKDWAVKKRGELEEEKEVRVEGRQGWVEGRNEGKEEI